MPLPPPRQYVLPLEVTASAAPADFLPDTSNAEARHWLREPQRWPSRRLVLWGPAGVGKSHLAHSFATRHGWRILAGASLRSLPPPAIGTVLDDADLVPQEQALLHLINLCAERGEGLLLIARSAPTQWRPRQPDLASRLIATAAVAISRPSDELLAALLAKFFADRQLQVAASLQAWLLARLQRDPTILAEAVARLDRAALAYRLPITPRLAAAVLAGWEGFDPLGEDTPATTTAQGTTPSPISVTLL